MESSASTLASIENENYNNCLPKRLKENAQYQQTKRTENCIQPELTSIDASRVYPEFCVNVLRECKQQKLV